MFQYFWKLAGEISYWENIMFKALGSIFSKKLSNNHKESQENGEWLLECSSQLGDPVSVFQRLWIEPVFYKTLNPR